MSVIFTLEKPKISNHNFKISLPLSKEIFDFYFLCSEKNYYYWDKVKYKEPAPSDYLREELWYNIKQIRKLAYQKTPIKNLNGDNFVFKKLKKFDDLLLKIDKLNQSKREESKNIFENILKEAIFSAQIEGVKIKKEKAREFLIKKNIPKLRAEQIILNNYNLIQKTRRGYFKKEMSLNLLKEMYAEIAFKMYNFDKRSYKLRDCEDVFNVEDSDTIYHVAPCPDFVEKELVRFVDFANKEDGFHPVIKAIILHFWLSYLHPFTDGNGRLARSVFYWSLFRDGYEIFSHLSLSSFIKKSHKDYFLAYIYSEQDDFDLTYFIDYNIDRVAKAFEKYVNDEQKKEKEKFQEDLHLNKRQMEILSVFFLKPEADISVKIYKEIYQITRKTAAKDLRDLNLKGYLISKKQGVNIFYYPNQENIAKIFKK